MSFADTLRSVSRQDRPSTEQLGQLAREALTEQCEDQALPLLEAASRGSGDARLWQWKALLERSLDHHAKALESFAQASAALPNDPSIANGYARTVLEAGLPSVDLFTKALRLAPGDAQVYLGLNSARIADGQAELAEAELDAFLDRNPMFLDGHHQLAQVRSLLGKRNQAFSSLERAIARDPQRDLLWQALFELQIHGENYELLHRSVQQASAQGRSFPALQLYKFIAASELGQVETADTLLAGEVAVPPIWRIRHALRSGRLEQAAALVERELSGANSADMWPYAATVWRLAGDPRYEWLTGIAKLVTVTDVSEQLSGVPALAERLRALHSMQGRYLNQSVRSGTQTEGHLFSRIEPEIRALRAIVRAAVANYSAALGAIPDEHPQAHASPVRKVRFSGSWSVRLAGSGFHTNHVHPRGWISSALYVGLPDTIDEGDPFGGWLVLGEPPAELGLDLPPVHKIRPKAGQLVLFPSWLWHGTRPFRSGERLTVAFDVARPV